MGNPPNKSNASSKEKKMIDSFMENKSDRLAVPNTKTNMNASTTSIKKKEN